MISFFFIYFNLQKKKIQRRPDSRDFFNLECFILDTVLCPGIPRTWPSLLPVSSTIVKFFVHYVIYENNIHLFTIVFYEREKDFLRS